MKNTRRLALTGIFSAMAFLLMMLEFPLAFVIPDFIKFDFSELPALICAFSAGPLWGGAVCLVKNLLHLPFSMTGGVGELANFLLGICFVIPAGTVYKKMRTKSSALIGCAAGMILGSIVSFPVNYFITYPFYTNFMPTEAIIAAYRMFLPSINALWQALLVFNLPFTFVKFTVDSAITFLIYKRISPLLKGKHGIER